MRQLSLVRSLQHDANYVNGCFCKIETRQGAHVRALQRKKLVDAGKKKKRGVGREPSSIYVSSYCYICPHTTIFTTGMKEALDEKPPVVPKGQVLCSHNRTVTECCECVLERVELDFDVDGLYLLSDSQGPGHLHRKETCVNGHADWVRCLALVVAFLQQKYKY